MKINAIHTAHLRNDEHFQFITEVKDLILVSSADTLKIPVQFNNYMQCYGAEDEAFKKIIKSAITDDIETADRTRDLTFRGMADTCRAALHHFDPAVVAAARRLKIVFDTYGNVAKKPLNEETSAIYNLMQELTGRYAPDMMTVGLVAWAQRLEVENHAFEALVRNRNAESAARTQLRMKECRLATDLVYAEIVERINALILIEGAVVYTEFVLRLNTFIERYNNTVAQRTGRAKAKKTKNNEQ